MSFRKAPNPIFQAAESGDTDNVLRLLKNEGSDVNAKMEDGSTIIPTLVLAYAYAWNAVTELNLNGLWRARGHCQQNWPLGHEG